MIPQRFKTWNSLAVVTILSGRVGIHCFHAITLCIEIRISRRALHLFSTYSSLFSRLQTWNKDLSEFVFKCLAFLLLQFSQKLPCIAPEIRHYRRKLPISIAPHLPCNSKYCSAQFQAKWSLTSFLQAWSVLCHSDWLISIFPVLE